MVAAEDGPRAQIAWALWFCFAFAAAIGPFLWHVDLFRTHSPKLVVALLPFVVPALAVGAVVYHYARRFDLYLLVGVPILVAAFREPLPTLLAVIFFLSAHNIGSWLLEKLRFDEVDQAMGIALAFALGSGVYILLLFGCGLAHLYYPAVLLSPLLVPLALQKHTGKVLDWLRAAQSRCSDDAVMGSPLISLVIYASLIFGALSALYSITPTIAFDPLKMHLNTSAYYVQQHALVPMPSLPESFYPQSAEVLMTFLAIFGGQPAAQLVSPVFFACVLLLLGSLLRRCELTRAAALTGVAAALSIPFLHWTGSVAKNDLMMAFFLLAALAALAREAVTWSHLALASFFVAMAFGVKHVALFGGVALVPVFVWAWWRQPRRAHAAAAIVIPFLLFGLLWQTRTFLYTGNPLFPESRARTAEFSIGNHPKFTAWNKFMRYAGIPALLHFDGQRAFESTSHNPLGMWLVFFWPGWIALRRVRNRALQAVALFSMVYLLYWVSVLVTLRYAIAPILLIAGLTATPLPRLSRWLTLPAAGFAFLFALTVCVLIEIGEPQLAWYAGVISTEQFLREALPSYPPIEALNHEDKPGDRIFSLENCATRYSNTPDTFYCAFQNDLGNSPTRIADRIVSGNFRWLILPNLPVKEKVLELLAPKQRLDERYHDASFTVFSGTPSGSVP